MINLYLFKNQSDLLDTLSKISDIVIAILTLLFSIFVFYFTFLKEKKNIKYDKKIDFFKTIILSNMTYLFNFYHQILFISKDLKTREITDAEKMAMNDLMQDELKNFRLNFYDLIITYDNNFYNFIKNESDGLIDILTNNIFNDSGTLLPNKERIPIANAMSVAIGIPAPACVAVPKLNRRKIHAGMIKPPMAPIRGKEAFFISESSPL